MKLYISGRITGLPYEEAEKMFNAAQAFLETQGFEVLNPTKNGLAPQAPWCEHMLADIRMLFSADGIFMLSDWQESRGARIEHGIAKEMGLPVYYCGL